MKYKYTLEYIKIIDLGLFTNVKLDDYICKHGYIKNNFLIIYGGYSWDGATVVPDTDKTYIASLIHDFLYQYKVCKRKDADKIFYDRLLYDKFEFSGLYYIGVRLFGYYFYTY